MRALTVFGLSCGLVACEEKKSPPPTPPVPRAVEKSVQDEGEPLPWFVGEFEALAPLQRLADPLTLERAERNEKGKKRDSDVPPEQSRGGELKLVVAIGKDRIVSGEGTMGPSTATIRGVLEGDSLRARLIGEKFNGTIVCDRSKEGFSGHAHLSALEGEDDNPQTVPLKGSVELYPQSSRR